MFDCFDLVSFGVWGSACLHMWKTLSVWLFEISVFRRIVIWFFWSFFFFWGGGGGGMGEGTRGVFICTCRKHCECFSVYPRNTKITQSISFFMGVIMAHSNRPTGGSIFVFVFIFVRVTTVIAEPISSVSPSCEQRHDHCTHLRSYVHLFIVLRETLTTERAGHHELTFTWWWFYGLFLWHKPTQLAHSFSLCSCASFCLYGLFNCISIHKFSRQLSAFSLCSSSLISALLVLSTIYVFMKAPFSPDIILCSWLDLKHQLTN